MWFEKLVGFVEEDPEQVRRSLVHENDKLTSKVNGRSFTCGVLEIPTLEELRTSIPAVESFGERISIRGSVGDIKLFHVVPENEGALFQAASQFNLLEMVGPSVTPEKGVGIYEMDNTQGPACAIACGAGTIYRNYFVECEGQIGQSTHTQIDCLGEIGNALKNRERGLWEMKNGYALMSNKGLETINEQLSKMDTNELEELKGKLRIGVQWNTEVTIAATPRNVSQAYCSALPVAYSNIPSEYWKIFAQLILDATYEATFYAALKNYEATGNNRLFLTLVGGGVFGNDISWIIKAIKRSLHKFRTTPLDVRIVGYERPDPLVNDLVSNA